MPGPLCPDCYPERCEMHEVAETRAWENDDGYREEKTVVEYECPSCEYVIGPSGHRVGV